MPDGRLHPYDREKGISYARMYALYKEVPQEKRLFFYAANELDCANFASQCLWAAYGGWLPGEDEPTIVENRKRIANMQGMVPGTWYGSATFAGPARWSGVEALFAYLIANQSKGPRGVKTAEGTWDKIDPGLIQAGDIIQMVVAGYADYRYGHTLYVTQEGPTFGDILICCHSYDRRDSPLSEFSGNPDMYKKMRLIRMKDAYFNR